MAGEIIQATTTQEAQKQLLSIYKQKSLDELKIISREEYEAIDKSEHEDSDNHLNIDRVGHDTKIVDLAYYKFLPDQTTAFRIDLIDANQKVKQQLFFIIKPIPDQ